MRVRWLRTALKNLDDEATLITTAPIATDNPQPAREVIARITRTVELLGGQPALGRPGRVPGTRELVIPGTRYLVPYRARQDSVEILRLFRTARRVPHRW